MRCVSRLVLVPMFCFRDQSANQRNAEPCRHRERGEPILVAGFVRVHNTTINKEAHDTIFKMASMNFSSGKQFVKPPQRGIFPLDHDAECKPKMQVSYLCVCVCVCVVLMVVALHSGSREG